VKKGKEVLLVDDDEGFRFSASTALKAAGYEVTEAANGMEALEKILERKGKGEMFSLLATDIRMPVMSGITLLDRLNRHKIRLPVIAFTGFHDKKLAGEIESRGTAECIEKPFEPNELLERIEEFLDGKTMGEASL